MARIKPQAGSRLLRRLFVLLVVGVASYYLQRRYEAEGGFWLLVMELSVYFFGAMYFLSTQTGRLKSGPDTGRRMAQELIKGDKYVAVYSGIYLFVLMLAIVGRVMFVEPIDADDIGPWHYFAVVTPLILIVIFRLYALERKLESAA